MPARRAEVAVIVDIWMIPPKLLLLNSPAEFGRMSYGLGERVTSRQKPPQ
jgi:hypothetical protein